MAIPKTSPVVNRPGPVNQFKPLPSAGGVSPDRLSFSEMFASHAPPGVLAAEASVNVSPTRFESFAPATDLTPVLQLTSQVPEPCVLVLGAWFNEVDRYRDPVRLPARVERAIGAAWVRTEGRFVVEWGVGTTRNYVFTDLAPGSLQIPIASFVRVWAHVWNETAPPGPSGVVAAAAGYLGQQHPSPDAAYTVIAAKRVGDPAADISVATIVPPWARDVSGSVCDDANPAAAVATLRLVDFFNAVPVGCWTLAAPNRFTPFAATNPTLPHELRRVPLPGGIASATIGLHDAPGVALAGASFAFGVRL